MDNLAQAFHTIKRCAIDFEEIDWRFLEYEDLIKLFNGLKRRIELCSPDSYTNPASPFKAVYECLENRAFIKAIKVYRDTTGISSIKEAKSKVETLLINMMLHKEYGRGLIEISKEKKAEEILPLYRRYLNLQFGRRVLSREICLSHIKNAFSEASYVR